MPYERQTEFTCGATYVGRVSKYGARWIDVNGHKTIQFTLLMPSSRRHETGRFTFAVRCTVFGGTDLPGGNDYVRCIGLPFSEKDGKGGIWNTLLVRGADNIEILSHWKPKGKQ